jgi:hypothetical protein
MSRSLQSCHSVLNLTSQKFVSFVFFALLFHPFYVKGIVLNLLKRTHCLILRTREEEKAKHILSKYSETKKWSEEFVCSM